MICDKDRVADKQKRIARVAEAKAELEAEAKAAADEERRIKAEKQKQREAGNELDPLKSPAVKGWTDSPLKRPE